MQFGNLRFKGQLIESMILFTVGMSQYLVFGYDFKIDTQEHILIFGSYSGFTWLLLWKGSTGLYDSLDRWITWVKYPGTRLIAGIISVTAMVFVVTFLIHNLYAIIFNNDGATRLFEAYSLRQYFMTLVITLLINTLMHGRGFLLNWRQVAIDIEKMKTEQISTKFISLKNQINPHFLFNSLNALSSLVYDDQKKAIRFIRKLSEVYRYLLDNKDEELTTTMEEMSFVESYMYLQKIRFGDNLKIIVEGQPVGNVPPLAVQLLVENAIKHNIISTKSPLTVELSFDQKSISVKNKINRNKTDTSLGVGLKNLLARYQFFTTQQVEIKDDDKYFTVTLPILELES